MWTDQLKHFERAVRQAFDFLHEEKGYSEPSVEYARDFFLIYDNPSEHTQICIGWERDWFLPFIFLRPSDDDLPEILKKLGIDVDASAFPTCERIARRKIPGIRELWIHWRKKRELVEEYPHFVEQYGITLRNNFDRILQEVHNR